MLGIKPVYFYSDKECTFSKGFQCGHLLLEAWDAGIRPLAVCLYMTLGCTLKKFLDLPWVLTIMWPQKLVTFSFLMWVKCGAQ